MCNPHDATNGVPTDWCIFQIIVVLFFQMLVKGAQREFLAFAWAVAFIMLNVSLVQARSDEYVFIDLLLFILMICSYEIERYSISFFISKKLEIDAQRQLAIAVTRNQLLNEENEIEKHLNAELQADITNSAHDIRSPCCAVNVAIDSLLSNELLLKEQCSSALIDVNLSIIESISQIITSIVILVDRTMVSDIFHLMYFLTVYFSYIDILFNHTILGYI